MASSASAYAAESFPLEVGPRLVGHTAEEVERELILRTLACHDGNRTHTARSLGISVRTLRNKIREYAMQGVPVPAPRGGNATPPQHRRPDA